MRELSEADLAIVVDLHLAAFPSNVWSRLGGRLLRTYLLLFLQSPHASALAALAPGTDQQTRYDGSQPPAGYLVGVLDTQRHRQWVRRHGMSRLAWALPGALVRHPLLLAGLLRRRLAIVARRTRSAPETTTATAAPRPGPTAVLSHIAVDPTHRGHGLGEAMVRRFLSDAETAGARHAFLATLEDGGAGAWYESRGWALDARRQTFDGRWIRIYRHGLNQQDGDA